MPPQDGERLFPIGQDRKNYLARTEERAQKQGMVEQRPIGLSISYLLIDSPLYPADEKARPEESFALFFKPVVPEKDGDLGKYLQRVLRKGSIGIEFGGQAKNLFHDFKKHFPELFAEFIGVALGEYDAEHTLDGHTFIAGDMRAEETYEAIDKKLQGRKVGFIMERMMRGLDFMPVRDPITLANLVQRWYGMLDDDGVLLLQIPSQYGDALLTAWVDRMREESHGTLEIHYAVTADGAMLMLRKLDGAPDALPMLSVREMHAITEPT